MFKKFIEKQKKKNENYKTINQNLNNTSNILLENNKKILQNFKI